MSDDDDYEDEISAGEEEDEITDEDEVTNNEGDDEDEQQSVDTTNEGEEEGEANDEDYPGFEQGLTVSLRSIVREARRIFFDKRASETRSSVQQQVKHDVDEEWKGVVTLPDLQSTTFDFQILRNLLQDSSGSDNTSTHFVQEDKDSLHRRKLKQLQARQKGDIWRYDIGLNEEEPEEETIDDLIADDE
jgi:hypothetical protein